MGLEFFDESRKLIDKIEQNESENIKKAAQLVAESIMNGGVLQAFGGGHSFAGAMELAGRAGGLIPTTTINDPSRGEYERIEGIGTFLMNKVNIDPNDVFVLISNSGRNPQLIEMAQYIKEKGNKLIVVTSLEVSKEATSRHSSGKKLYEFADVVLNNYSNHGDAVLSIEGFDSKVSGTSTVGVVVLLQQMNYEAIKIMVEAGFNPPVYKSVNVDGGPEHNADFENKYAHRIYKF